MDTMINIITGAETIVKWGLMAVAAFGTVVVILFYGARAITSGILDAKNFYKKKKKKEEIQNG